MYWRGLDRLVWVAVIGGGGWLSKGGWKTGVTVYRRGVLGRFVRLIIIGGELGQERPCLGGTKKLTYGTNQTCTNTCDVG